jgi:hypothetical protein
MSVSLYRDLVVWQKAMDLVMEMYRITAAFPREELFGLTLTTTSLQPPAPSP